MSRRNVILLIAIFVTVLVVGVSVAFALWPSAAEEIKKDVTDNSGDWNESADYITFELNADGNSYAVTGYTGRMPNLIIPSEYNSKPVTVIKGSLSNIRSITSLVIPSSVMVIEDNALINSLSLVAVEIKGTSGLSIGKNCFRGNGELKTVNYTAGRLSSLGTGAFANCDKLSVMPSV